MTSRFTNWLSNLKIMNLTLFKIWSGGWKSKSSLILLSIYFIISVPTVPLGSWTGYYLIEYFQNKANTKNLVATIETNMYKSINWKSINSSAFNNKIEFIRDALVANSIGFSKFIPYNFDSISIKTIYNFDKKNGITLVDFFLDCGCDEGSGTMTLLECIIDPETLEYKWVNDVDIGWDFYLNPWAEKSSQQRGD